MQEIEATLYFKDVTASTLLSTFLAVPVADLRPERYKLDESGPDSAIRVPDVERILSKGTGLFLKSARALYDVGTRINGTIICNCWFKADPNSVRQFVKHMALANPLFGLACDPEERVHRNLITIKFDGKTMDAWVGRDPLKAIPGIYWITVISQALIERHKLPIAELQRSAVASSIINNQTYIIEMYTQPDKWVSYQEKLDAICSSVNGIFDIEKVKNGIPNDAGYLQMSSYLAQWQT